MPQPGEPGWPGTGDPVLPDSDELDTLPDLFGSDLAHLFDYCRALLGQDAEAARTARSVLDSAHALLHDPDRLRAWLFALGRRQALALRPPSSDELSYMPLPLIAASSQQTDNAVLRALRALTHRDREILDLVYRHGIRPADLPAVLEVPPEKAYRCLVNAEEEFINLAAEPEARPGADLEEIAALPLAPLPAAEAERQLGHRPARQFERAVLWRTIAQRRVQFAAAAVIPVAATVGAVVYLAAPGHPAASHGASVLPRSGTSQASQRASTPSPAHTRQAAQAKHSSAPSQPVFLGVPVASRTTATSPTPTSSPSRTPTTSPKAKPSPPPPPSPKPKPSPPPPP